VAALDKRVRLAMRAAVRRAAAYERRVTAGLITGAYNNQEHNTLPELLPVNPGAQGFWSREQREAPSPPNAATQLRPACASLVHLTSRLLQRPRALAAWRSSRSRMASCWPGMRATWWA
jgi:hypothetical protein